MRRARAATIGYQGNWNVGDEAILAGIESLLAESGLDVVAVFAGLGPVAAFPQARRVVLRRLLPSARVLRELRAVDWLVLAGGGLINDYWLRAIPRYLGWIIAARLAGAHVVWIGVGVGPVRRRSMRLLVKLAAALSDLVMVRDAESRSIVGATALRRRVHVIPDPAFFLPAYQHEGPRSGTALVVRPPAPTDVAGSEELVRGLCGVAVGLIDERREHVTLVTMGGREDQGLAGQADASLVSRVRSVVLAERPAADIRVVELGPDPSEAMSMFATHSLVISMRLHGLILGSLAGTPCLPIAYDPKVRSTARRLGLQDVTLSLGDVSWAHVASLLAAVDSTQLRAQVAKALGDLQSQVAVSRAIVKHAVEARVGPRSRTARG